MTSIRPLDEAARAAIASGAEARAVMRQGEFLLRLGLIQRAEVLARGKDKARHDSSRATAWCVTDAAEIRRPAVILVENVTDFVTMASPDGRFTWASPSVANVVGWTAEEVCGQSVLAYLHPHDAPRLLELREQMAEGRLVVPAGVAGVDPGVTADAVHEVRDRRALPVVSPAVRHGFRVTRPC